MVRERIVNPSINHLPMIIPHYRRTLTTLFDKVHQLKANPNNNDLCLEVQETLIEKITYVESRVRSIKDQISISKRCLRTAKVKLTKAEARERKAQIANAHKMIESNQQLLVVFRGVGDAVAFTYLSKWDIKPMAYKESAGFISSKKGNRLERKILRGAFRSVQRLS